MIKGHGIKKSPKSTTLLYHNVLHSSGRYLTPQYRKKVRRQPYFTISLHALLKKLTKSSFELYQDHFSQIK